MEEKYWYSLEMQATCLSSRGYCNIYDYAYDNIDNDGFLSGALCYPFSVHYTSIRKGIC